MSTPATPPHPLTREEADGELRRLDEESDRMAAALLALDSHDGHRFLREAPLTGVTLQRWTATQPVMAALWRQFELYRRVLEDVRRVRARRSRPGPHELAELGELLYGPAIELSREALPLAQRSLTGPAERTQRVSLVELVARMQDDYARASAVISSTDRVWSALAPRLDTLEQRLRSLRAGAASLGAEETALASVETELAELRRLVLSDPLSLDHYDTVRADRFDRAHALLDALGERLHELTRLREEYDVRVARVRGLLAEIEATQHRARRARTEALTTIAVSTLPDVEDVAAGLRRRVAGLDALKAEHRWQRLSDELASVEGAANTAGDAARERLAMFTGLLDRRVELRGRLEAYRAKAARLGRGEDSGLMEYYRVARDLLGASPCDLRAATKAVARYQQAILEHAGQSSPRHDKADKPEESSR